jgi:hypothetical protein
MTGVALVILGAETGFGQWLLEFRRKSFCDGPRIVAERFSWCHV